VLKAHVSPERKLPVRNKPRPASRPPTEASATPSIAGLSRGETGSRCSFAANHGVNLTETADKIPNAMRPALDFCAATAAKSRPDPSALPATSGEGQSCGPFAGAPDPI
jgi:hypothetical protein